MARTAKRGVVPASGRLGRAVAAWRKAAHLSQSELATRLGWSVRTLSNMENGRRPVYDEGEVIAIGRALGVEEGMVRDLAIPSLAESTDEVVRAISLLAPAENDPRDAVAMAESAVQRLRAYADLVRSGADLLLEYSLSEDAEDRSQAERMATSISEAGLKIFFTALTQRPPDEAHSAWLALTLLSGRPGRPANVSGALGAWLEIETGWQITGPGEEAASVSASADPTLEGEEGLQQAADAADGLEPLSEPPQRSHRASGGRGAQRA